MKNDLDKIFMQRIMKAALAITIVVGAILFGTKTYLHIPAKFAEGYITGSVLTVANVFFMKQFVIFFTSAAKRNPLRIALCIAGLLATVAGILASAYLLNPVGVTVGFTVILGVMLVVGMGMIKHFDQETKDGPK